MKRFSFHYEMSNGNRGFVVLQIGQAQNGSARVRLVVGRGFLFMTGGLHATGQ